ncbi:MAG: glycosyltransferase family 4 protein [bacterium]|nr:glycosyltransferase family 4 protein [bacterium]
MQIFVFTTTYFPFIGGAEVAIREIARRSPQHEWILFCARLDRALPESEVIERVTVRRLGWGSERIDKYLLPISAFVAARKYAVQALRRGQRPVLWPVMASYGAFGALFVKLRYPDLPLVLTLQEGDSEAHVRHRLRLAGAFGALLFRRVDCMTVISRYLGDFARRLGYKGRITVVPNGVDGRRFDASGAADISFGDVSRRGGTATGDTDNPVDEGVPRPRTEFIPGVQAATREMNSPEANSQRNTSATEAAIEGEVIKKSLGIPAGTQVIVTVSRLVEKNGLEDLLYGFKRLCSLRAPPPHLIIVGAGHLKERLETLVQELELIDVAHLVGNVEHEDVAQYLAIADVFIRPSRSEGLGNAFLEAMSAGVPIVGTPVGGIPDFLVDGETGLFCQPGDAASIALALGRLLDDASLRHRVINNGYAVVSERYSWDKIAARMDKVFQSVL